MQNDQGFSAVAANKREPEAQGKKQKPTGILKSRRRGNSFQAKEEALKKDAFKKGTLKKGTLKKGTLKKDTSNKGGPKEDTPEEETPEERALPVQGNLFDEPFFARGPVPSDQKTGQKDRAREKAKGVSEEETASGEVQASERQASENQAQMFKDRSSQHYFHYCDWKGAVDQILFEKKGIATAVFPESLLGKTGWKKAYQNGLSPVEAAWRAGKFLRENRLPKKENQAFKKRRRVFRHLMAGKSASLKRVIQEADDELLRCALRLAGPAQQKQIESHLEKRVAMMAEENGS